MRSEIMDHMICLPTQHCPAWQRPRQSQAPQHTITTLVGIFETYRSRPVGSLAVACAGQGELEEEEGFVEPSAVVHHG